MADERINMSESARDPLARRMRLDSSRSTEIGRVLRQAFGKQRNDDVTDRELRNLLEQLS